MEVVATGVSTAVAVTLQATANTVTRVAHGLVNGTPVSFATIVTTTGIATYTRYFVVGKTDNTFQVALTVGGDPIDLLTGDGSGTLLYGTTIVSIAPNVSITLSVPASASATNSKVCTVLAQSIARLKGWTVTI